MTMVAVLSREQLSESRKMLVAVAVMAVTVMLTGLALTWIYTHVHGHNAIAGAFFGAVASLPVWVLIALAIWLLR